MSRVLGSGEPSFRGPASAESVPSPREIPRAAVIRAGTVAAVFSCPRGTTTPRAATADPCGPKTGTAMPVVSGIDDAGQCGASGPPDLRPLPAQDVGSRKGRRIIAVPGQELLLDVPGRVRHQHHPGGGNVQRQPPCYFRKVGDRAAAGEPFNEEHLVLLQDGKLGVLADHGLDVLHERHGHLTQVQCSGTAARQLPQPQAQTKLTLIRALQQRQGHQFPGQPVRSGEGQPCPRARMATGMAGCSASNAEITRTMRSAMESPEGELAIPVLWHTTALPPLPRRRPRCANG